MLESIAININIADPNKGISPTDLDRLMKQADERGVSVNEEATRLIRLALNGATQTGEKA